MLVKSLYTPPPLLVAVFPEMVVLVKVAVAALYTPPPTLVVVFPEMVLLVKDAMLLKSLYTPPPPPLDAVFPEMVVLVKVTVPRRLYTPPPKLALFPEMVVLVKVAVAADPLLNTPPPCEPAFSVIAASVRYRAP